MPHSRDYFLSLFRQADLTPRIAGAYAHFDVIRGLVARGDGYSLANAQPKNQASLDGRKLAYLALEPGLTPLVHGIATLAGLRHTPTLTAFMAFCREILAGKTLPGTL